MADPFRLQVLKALTAHLEGIVHVDPDPLNSIVGVDWRGFVLTGKVFRGRTYFGQEAPETFLSLLEAPRPDQGTVAGTNNTARHEEWPLLLQGWCPDDKENPTDPVYFLMDVVERRLGEIVSVRDGSGLPTHPGSYMLGGLISDFAFGPGVVRPPTEGISAKAFFYLPLRVGLATVVG